MADLSELPEGDWFCGGECARISGALQGLVARGPQALPQYVMAGGKPVGDGRERTWQLLRGRQGSKDNGKVLAAAVDILSVRRRHTETAQLIVVSACLDCLLHVLSNARWGLLDAIT